MTSEDLTPDQAKAVGIVVGRHLRYLGRLRDRMQRRGFPPNDPLVLSLTEAYNAIHGLNVRLHYLGCRHGVGRPAKPQPDTDDASKRLQVSENVAVIPQYPAPVGLVVLEGRNTQKMT